MPSSSVTVSVNTSVAHSDMVRTVSFDKGTGGRGSMSSVNMAVGSSYVVPKCSFLAPASHYFAGWQAEGDPVLKQPGDILTLTESVTLTAVWTEVPFGVADVTLPAQLMSVKAEALYGIRDAYHHGNNGSMYTSHHYLYL